MSRLLTKADVEEYKNTMCCMMCRYSCFNDGEELCECRRHAPSPVTYAEDDLEKDKNGFPDYPYQHDNVEWPRLPFWEWCGDFCTSEQTYDELIEMVERNEKMEKTWEEINNNLLEGMKKSGSPKKGRSKGKGGLK